MISSVHERKRLEQLKKIKHAQAELEKWESERNDQKVRESREKLASIKEFEPDTRTVDYFNKLKAKYVSTKEYAYMATRLGFLDFIVMGPRDVHEEQEAILEDCLEAFFGCFEMIIDRYVEMNYSHHYVASFMAYMSQARHINYHPDILYDYITLLKETNDMTKNDALLPNGTIQPGFKHELFFDNNASAWYVFYIDVKTNHRNRIYEVPTINNKSKASQAEMSKRVLEYLKKNQAKFPTMKIKMAPTPEELGIEELCT
jgi:hypothetical protein